MRNGALVAVVVRCQRRETIPAIAPGAIWDVLRCKKKRNQQQPRFFSSSTEASTSSTTASYRPLQEQTVSIRFEHGLPVITVPLPSRRELCAFTLRPIADTVGSLCQHLSAEDSRIHSVAVYNVDGVRISSGTSIEHLLQFARFRLHINDSVFEVQTPSTRELDDDDSEDHRLALDLSSDDRLRRFSDIKAAVATLHAALNIDEFKLRRERQLMEKLENVMKELGPMQELKSSIDAACDKYCDRLLWFFFGAMGLQTGIFARLTWWEYSWDIVEPITYFATYAVVSSSLGYFLLTRQSFEYPSFRDRVYLRHFHRLARRSAFDIERFNRLQESAFALRRDLERLRDPLHQFLPATRLAQLLASGEIQSALNDDDDRCRPKTNDNQHQRGLPYSGSSKRPVGKRLFWSNSRPVGKRLFWSNSRDLH